jgi:hypothetical protein
MNTHDNLIRRLLTSIDAHPYAWLYIGVVCLVLVYALVIGIFEPFSGGAL